MDPQTPTPDEQPKQAVAKKLVTEKRRWFFPQHSINVVADDIVQAEQKLKAKLAGTKKVTRVRRKTDTSVSAVLTPASTEAAPTSVTTETPQPEAPTGTPAEPTNDVEAGDV